MKAAYGVLAALSLSGLCHGVVLSKTEALKRSRTHEGVTMMDRVGLLVQEMFTYKDTTTRHIANKVSGAEKDTPQKRNARLGSDQRAGTRGKCRVRGTSGMVHQMHRLSTSSRFCCVSPAL